MSIVKTIQIWSDTRGRSTCKGCRAPITWGEVVTSGRRMCFSGTPVALSTHHDPASRRLVEVLDLAENHWASCPDAKTFKRKS